MSNLPDVPPIGFLGRTRDGVKARYVGVDSGNYYVWFVYSEDDREGEYMYDSPYECFAAGPDDLDIIAPWEDK